MLCTRGHVRDFVKVLDFGLVKDVASEADVKLTSDKAIAGTPLYLAPECIVAPEAVGPAADTYALGCVAYFLLTGRPPFDGQHLVEVCVGHLHGVVEAPSARAPRPISSELDALVLRCLAKKPEDRPLMAELSERLARLPRAS
jgi:serine/threonine-protein kinase